MEYFSTYLSLIKVIHVLTHSAELGPETRSGKINLRLFC